MRSSVGITGVVSLTNEELVVDCTPLKGCDVTQIRDRKTGSTVLWSTPWTTPTAPHGRAGDSDAENWLFHYPGGWQLLLRSEEHTSELQSHSFISYAVFCLTKKN